MMNRMIAWWVIALALASAGAACADQRAVREAASVTVGPLRTVPKADRPGVLKEFTVTVRPNGGGEERNFTVRGPDDLIDPGERPRADVVGERLLVYSRSLIAVFDLVSGDQVVDVVTAPGVTVASDSQRVAFETLQLPFTPAEATSSVIQVLDVPSLKVEPVFPGRSTIQPSQFGRLLAWVDTPEDRHAAGRLFFSPDGFSLVFFCTHDPAGPDASPEQFLVLVDLSRGLDESRFVHRPFDWEAHLRPGTQLGERKPFFAVESATWLEDGTLIVKPPRYARWLEEEIGIELPGPEDWPAQDGGEDEEP